MAITFDAATKRIILDSASTNATEIYSRWVDWAATSDNIKYGMVFRQVGSDDLGAGLSIPPYYFLQGAWRIRPMEIDHDLSVLGNIFVETGESPFVRTLGAFQVNIRSTVAVQAQGISTSGGASPSAAEVWAYPSRQLTVAAGLTPSQEAKLTAIPTNPLLTTDVRLNRLDANISSITGSTPAEIWAHTTRSLTVNPVTDLTPVLNAIAALNDITAADVEAALLNEADGQTLLNSIVSAIGNTNISEVALVAAIRSDMERIGGMLSSVPKTLVDLTSILNAITALNNISVGDIEGSTLLAKATALSDIAVSIANIPTTDNVTDLTPVLLAISGLNDVTPEEVRAAFITAEFKDKNTELELHAWLDSYLNKDSWKGLTSLQDTKLNHLDIDVSSLLGSSSLTTIQNDKLMSLGTPTDIVTELMVTPIPVAPVANTFGDLIKNKILTIFRFNTYK